MTECTVRISITISVADGKVRDFVFEVNGKNWDEELRRVTHELSQEMSGEVLTKIDDDLAKRVPGDWKNVGKEERQVISAIGRVVIRRRVYCDAMGRRRKPLDELLGMERYERLSWGVKRLGAYLASRAPYRQAAQELSWMIEERMSHSGIQRIVWGVGGALDDGERREREGIFSRGEIPPAGRVAAEVLYGEADGVWISLQREERRKAEVRVGIMYTGKRAIAAHRRGLEQKTCLTAIVEDSEEWQEMLLKAAYSQYDLETTLLLIVGGDGATWVRHSFDRFEKAKVFQLDRFHLFRAARRALPHLQGLAAEWMKRCCAEGLAAVEGELIELMKRQSGAAKKKTLEFWKYLRHNAEGLIDYWRLLHLGEKGWPSLGAIEGNADKLVVQRMKGRGMSWRIPGAKAMLALSRHRTELEKTALRLAVSRSGPPVSSPRKHQRQVPSADADWLQRRVPALHSSAAGRPWVQILRQQINGGPDFSLA